VESNLIKIENGLLSVYKDENGNKVVNGRELWEQLDVKKEFSPWIKNNLELVDGCEGVDFTSFVFKEKAENTWKTSREYILKLEIAKEICMIAGANPRANKELKKKSKECRKYFIDIEKKYYQLQQDLLEKNELIIKVVNSDTEEGRMMALSRYNEMVNKELSKKDEIIKLQKPKVELANRFIESDGSLPMGNVAKLLNERLNKHKAIGKNRLYEILRIEEILISSSKEWNVPYQRFIDQDYFRVKVDEYIVNGEDKSTVVTYVTKKGVEWIWKMLVRKGYVEVEDLAS